jgi:hypothetical protein
MVYNGLSNKSLNSGDDDNGNSCVLYIQLQGKIIWYSWNSILWPSGSWDSTVGIATGYGLDDRGVKVKSPGRVKNFYFSALSKPTLGPTQPPIQWVPGSFFRGGLKLTTRILLVLRSRKCGTIHPVPHMPSWHCAQLVKHTGQFYLYLWPSAYEPKTQTY